MNYIGKFISNFKDFYNEINSATLTGAIDVIVVKREDGNYLCSPFHVRFGKMGVLRSKEKIVDIEVNGEPIDMHMKLGDTGEAFFIEEIDDDEEIVPKHLATSPLPDDISDVLAQEIEKLKMNDNDVSRETNKDEENNNNKSKSNESFVEKSEDALKSSDNVIIGDNIESHGYDKVQNDNSVPKEMITVAVQTDGDFDISEVPAIVTSTGTQQKRYRKRRKSAAVKSRQQKPKVKDNVENSIETTDSIGGNHSLNEEDIFQMDDDWDDDTIISSSVPTTPGTMKLSPFKLAPSYSTSFHNMHPFSDGEITPLKSGSPSRDNERPVSPDYKSDTEYEIQQKNDAMSQTEILGQVSWHWGELPRVPKKISNESVKPSAAIQSHDIVSSDDEDNRKVSNEKAQKSMLRGMLNFMKAKDESSSATAAAKEEKGIYLDDLNPEDLDPEVAALYFPRLRSQYPLTNSLRPTDDDSESGNGPSLPHSPQSLDVCPPSGSRSIDSGDSDQERAIICNNEFNSIFKIYHDFSMSVCGGIDELNRDESNSERFLHSIVSFDDYSENPTALLQNADLVIRMGGKFYNWQTAAPIIVSLIMFQRQLPEKTRNALIDQFMPKKDDKKQQQSQTSRSSWWSWRRSYASNEGTNKFDSNDLKTPSIELTEPASANHKDSENNVNVPNNEDAIYVSSGSEPEDNGVPIANGTLLVPNDSNKKLRRNVYKKSLRLTSDMIKSLNLHEGSNEVVFSVTTAYQGTSRCKCNIYLWNYDDKIVISDIDGTITKSDVLGHILPIVGRDWAQSGVANLYTKIRNNGYRFLYLSARAIGQARVTRDYLKSVRQGDLCLPNGPLLLSPTSLISAFHREVIEKKPEKFKISCLKDIQTLFPENPFYAGFGNKINDTWAYRAVDIPISRIFTVNYAGELRMELIQTFQSSYTSLTDVVDQMFPPVKLNQEKIIDSEFSSFGYWRESIPEISADDLLLKTPANETNDKKNDKKS